MGRTYTVSAFKASIKISYALGIHERRDELYPEMVDQLQKKDRVRNGS